MKDQSPGSGRHGTWQERPAEIRSVALTGTAEVWVNGRNVWREGASTGARPGRAIRRRSLTL